MFAPGNSPAAGALAMTDKAIDALTQVATNPGAATTPLQPLSPQDLLSSLNAGTVPGAAQLQATSQSILPEPASIGQIPDLARKGADLVTDIKIGFDRLTNTDEGFVKELQNASGKLTSAIDHFAKSHAATDTWEALKEYNQARREFAGALRDLGDAIG